MKMKPIRQNTKPQSRVKREPWDSTSLAEAGRRHDHAQGGGQDRRTSPEGRVFEHVLQILLPDEHGRHQGPEDDDPAVPATQKVRRPAIFKSYGGCRCDPPALLDEEADAGRHSDQGHRRGGPP